jgi:hypothetical protein
MEHHFHKEKITCTKQSYQIWKWMDSPYFWSAHPYVFQPKQISAQKKIPSLFSYNLKECGKISLSTGLLISQKKSEAM